MPGPTPSHRLAAGVVACLLGLGMVWGVRALAELPAGAVGPLSTWMDGTAGTALNEAITPPTGSVDTWRAALRYRLLGDTGPQVALGCPGWLFYRDGLRPQPGTPDVLDERLRLMRHWTGLMRSQGVQTLIVVVPDKSRIEADRLCGLETAASMRERLARWNAALRADGVPLVDLSTALEGAASPSFFRTDVHMNADGAARAARAVADAALGLLGGPGAQRFEVGEPGAPEPRMGDLIVLAGLEHAPEGWRPALDLVAPRRLAPIRAQGLLDETAPVEVMLAGSSNGRRSHFAEWLGVHLGREVWNLSMDGGQFAGALTDALERRGEWPASLRLVIWEFSEMALSLPLTEDERRALAGTS